MFFAVIVTCSTLLGCQELRDNRGPYDTIYSCEQRIIEMEKQWKKFVADDVWPPDSRLTKKECRIDSKEGKPFKGKET